MHGSDFSTPDTPALKALERGATNKKNPQFSRQ